MHSVTFSRPEPACAPRSPRRSCPDGEAGLNAGPVLPSPPGRRTGCDSARPAPFSHRKPDGGGESERTSRRANATAASASSASSRPPPPPLVGRRLGCRTFCLSSRSQSGALRLSRDCPPVKRLALGLRAGSLTRVAGTPMFVPRSLKTRNRLFRFGLKPRPRGASSP